MSGTGAVDMVVVGGGLAGIAAALEAADAGATVALVERRQRLGGLTWSFRRHGLWFDNGQHVFLRCCDEYLSFLERIGAAGDVVLQDRLDVPVLSPDGRRATIGRADLPAPLHLGGSVARYRHLSVADRLRLGPAVAALSRLDLDDPSLDGVTFGAWLERHHQRPRAIAALWDLITLPTVNVPAQQASLAMAAKVFRTGLLDSRDGGDIGWSAVPLGELHGTRAAAALAAAGVDVATGSRAEQIRPGADGGWQVVADGGARRWQAAAAVVAAPPGVASALLPEGTLPGVDGLGTSAVVDVQLVLDRTVTDLPFFAAVDSPVQFVFDRTAVVGATRGQCLALSLSGADRYLATRPEVLVGQFTEALARLLPGVRRAGVVDAVVTKEHAATFRAVPGTAALRPAPGPVAPGLAVAGAWCATGWPATMEGAVRSGRAAVRALLGRPAASRPSPLPPPVTVVGEGRTAGSVGEGRTAGSVGEGRTAGSVGDLVGEALGVLDPARSAASAAALVEVVGRPRRPTAGAGAAPPGTTSGVAPPAPLAVPPGAQHGPQLDDGPGDRRPVPSTQEVP